MTCSVFHFSILTTTTTAVASSLRTSVFCNHRDPSAEAESIWTRAKAATTAGFPDGESTPVSGFVKIIHTMKISASQLYIHVNCSSTAGGGSVTTQLNEADMEIMGDGACAAIWGSSFRADVHICITSPGEDKGSCNVRKKHSNKDVY